MTFGTTLVYCNNLVMHTVGTAPSTSGAAAITGEKLGHTTASLRAEIQITELQNRKQVCQPLDREVHLRLNLPNDPQARTS